MIPKYRNVERKPRLVLETSVYAIVSDGDIVSRVVGPFLLYIRVQYPLISHIYFHSYACILQNNLQFNYQTDQYIIVSSDIYIYSHLTDWVNDFLQSYC